MSDEQESSPDHHAAVFDLVESMLRRDSSRIDLARAAFRRKYPAATEQMIGAAVFHIFVDGILAARDWIADAELFLTDPEHKLSFGISSHLLYHVYNWHQLESLMPHGKQGMHELADDIARYANDGDLDAVKQAVNEFKELLEGHQLPPDIA